MGKKKKYRGHFCKICGTIKPNEKFSGKGHKNHICKKCAKLPSEEKSIMVMLNRIDKLYNYYNLSKNNKIFLEKLLNDKRERVREAAIEAYEHFTNKNDIPEIIYEEEYLDDYIEEEYISGNSNDEFPISGDNDEDFPF